MALEHDHNLLGGPDDDRTGRGGRDRAISGLMRCFLTISRFLPMFQPGNFSADYLDDTAQFDVGMSYLFERGKKRARRLQAAKDRLP